MDSNHLSALLLHNENEAKPKCLPFEHWIPNEYGNHPPLHEGYMFSECMDHDEFASKILLPLNNHMRKKGVECTSNNSSSTHEDQHGRMRTKKHVMCCQTIIPKKSKQKKESLLVN